MYLTILIKKKIIYVVLLKVLDSKHLNRGERDETVEISRYRNEFLLFYMDRINENSHFQYSRPYTKVKFISKGSEL